MKYYLRGLGIGMLVAALVLVLSGNTRAKMSDEAVKRRAAELGMVEKDKTVLDDIGGTAADAVSSAQPEDSGTGQPDEETPADNAVEPEEEIKPEEGAEVQPETPETGKDTPAEPEEAEPAKEQEQTQEIAERADEVANRAEEVAENSPAGRTVTLEVRRGDSSITVARRAAEAGLVQSAADFDVFLCRNGYDKRISVGSYEITEGMAEKEIADIITRSR